MVIFLRNVAKTEEFFRGISMKVVTGSRYLGGFISDREAEDKWLVEKVQVWAELVKTLSGVARNHM